MPHILYELILWKRGNLLMRFRVLFLLFFTCTFLITTSNVTFATHVRDLTEIMSFGQVPKFEMSGDVNGKKFKLNGEKLKLVPHLGNNSNRYVKLLSQDGENDYLSFPVERVPFFKAYKITLENDKEFILIKSGKQGVSDAICTGFWVVGKYKEKYTSFITLDTLINAGLIFEDIDISWDPFEIKLSGIVRNRSCINGLYKGHRTFAMNQREWYRMVNMMDLHWNDEKEWFGYRLDD